FQITFQNGDVVRRKAGEVHTAVIPISISLHQKRIDCIEGEARSDFQNVFRGGHKTWRWPAAKGSRKCTPETRSRCSAFLDEDVTAFGQKVDVDKNGGRR